MILEEDLKDVRRFIMMSRSGLHDAPFLRQQYYKKIYYSLRGMDVAYEDVFNAKVPEDLSQLCLLILSLKLNISHPLAGAMHIIRDPELLVSDFYPMN